MRLFKVIITGLLLVLVVVSCRKNDNPPGAPGTNKMYADSVYYIRSQAYVVSPLQSRAGTYSAYPGNLLIDPATGKITVTVMGNGFESQTGLRYKIKFQSTDGSVQDSTYIVLAGLNYIDRIYYLPQHDSIISPLYNAGLSNPLPAGTYGISPDSRLSIDPTTGKINVKESMRRGLFHLPAENGEWEEVTIQYKSNDNSNNATNSIDIALYYYNSLADVPSNVSAVMREHQKMVLGVPQPEVPVTFGAPDNDLPDNLSINRPRPPCIIIVAN